MIFQKCKTIALICGLLLLGFVEWANAELTFQPIYFDKGSDTLTRASKEALERVKGLLNSNPKVTLRLQGYASNESESIAPNRLALQRAESASEYLKKLGIADSRLNPRSFFDPSVKLPDPNDQQNRRVEFRFFEPMEQASDSKLEKINVVYWNTLYHCLYQIASSQGYFKDEGFEVNLIATNHSYINQVNASCGVEPFLEEGARIFVGAVCGGSPHEAIAQGVDLVVIGGLLAGGSMLMAKPDVATKLKADWKNFKGMRIGRPKGTVLTSMIVAHSASVRGGLNPLKDMIWKEYASHEEVLEALVKGEVDAGDTYAPLHITAEKKFGLVTVYNTVELFPYHPCCRVITTRDKLKKERAKYVRFMKAVIRAHEYFIKKPAQAIETVTQYTGYPKEEVFASLTNPNFLLNPDPLKNGFVKFWNMMLETGFIQSKKNIHDYIDTSIYEEALNALIKKEPANPYYQHILKQFKVQNF